IVYDTLKKTFEALGYDVTYVSNFTDVDDKIIKKAKEEGISETELTKKYIEGYNQDRLSLNADIPDITPKVTETMDEIIAFIQELVDNGSAYVIEGDVYFRVNAVENYGTLSKQKIDDLVVGARIDENSLKENPLDFTLWKKTSEGINWDSPWSKGRPGWHTECVVMINKEFHSHRIDIHGGGMDLKFPHHENEIAQSEACFHTHIANYWLHNGMLNMDGVKMSKSLGNGLLIKDMVKEIGGNVLRWVFLSAHYRAPLNFNDEAVENARKELTKIQNSYKQACVKMALLHKDFGTEKNELLWNNFLDAMSDDLNTPNAFSVVFETNKQLNQALRVREIDPNLVSSLVNTLEGMMYVLGIKIDRTKLDDEDYENYQKWNDAKAIKDFQTADIYRQKQIEKGVL
ncbi:MAG: cysteine--tRNA ligase, partial [Traorella sp.]